MPRVFFIAPHRPGRSPSQRFRFEQFVPYWRAQGYDFTYGWCIDEQDDHDFYRREAIVAKARVYANSWLRRSRLIEDARGHDLIILQRETFMTRGTYFERKLAATGIPLIYDFDDALWIKQVSEGNRMFAWMKDAGKINKMIPMADLVIAGNDFLAAYARRLNPSVVTIPTVVDTTVFRVHPERNTENAPLVIGWTGSKTTIPYLRSLLPALMELKRRTDVPFVLRVISDSPLNIEGLEVDNRKWGRESEVTDLQDIHIGIMPMERDEWSKGKCAFKGIQYMALGKPTILEDHGVNPSVVEHGKNGFLASSKEEWIRYLSQLLADADLRRRLGRAARVTVEERYSVQAWRNRYLELFDQLITHHRK